MSDDLKSKLDVLSEVATPGEISVHTLVDGSLYAGIEKPNLATLETVIFGIDAGPEYKDDYNNTAKANAELFATLINAYRSGALVTRNELDDAVTDALQEAASPKVKPITLQEAAGFTPKMAAELILEAGQSDALFGQAEGIHKQIMVATEGLSGSEAFIAGLRALSQDTKKTK